MKTFEELGVSPEIRRAIEEMGYEQPMPVQEEVIPYLLGENNDVVALAQTGTGKTAAYGLPLIQKTDVGRCEPQALILSPTRELCLQIAGDLNDYSKYIDGLHVLPVYGGSSIESQIRALKRGVHIIVATPGRLLDLMQRKTVSLATVRNVVLDEADEMLNMGFSESLNAILADVPQDRNTLLFSATMSAEISRIAQNYLHNAKEITLMYFKADVLKDFLLGVSLDALGPVQERLLQAAGLFGGQLERFGYMLHREHDRTLFILSAHNTVVRGYSSHYSTSANFLLRLRNTWIPSHRINADST